VHERTPRPLRISPTIVTLASPPASQGQRGELSSSNPVTASAASTAASASTSTTLSLFPQGPEHSPGGNLEAGADSRRISALPKRALIQQQQQASRAAGVVNRRRQQQEQQQEEQQGDEEEHLQRTLDQFPQDFNSEEQELDQLEEGPSLFYNPEVEGIAHQATTYVEEDEESKRAILHLLTFKFIADVWAS
jgi:TolA-binding protein